ncbi:MAG: chemotaxis protein CheX [Treponema sp.]|nr:chemotaxis protein CheX [Treponema sp.]
MDASIINPFIAATAAVFKEMFGLDAAPDKPYVLEESSDSKWEISGLIGLAGAAQGIVAVRLPPGLAETLLGRTGMTFKTDDEKKQMVGGLVAELTNIVSGNAAGRFKDINLDIAPPVVVRGDKHQISWPKIAPVLAVPMKTEAGSFELDVCFKGA